MRNEKPLYSPGNRTTNRQMASLQPSHCADWEWISLTAQSIVAQSFSIFGLTCVELMDRHFHINILQRFDYYLFGHKTPSHYSLLGCCGRGKGGGSTDNRHSVERIRVTKLNKTRSHLLTCLFYLPLSFRFHVPWPLTNPAVAQVRNTHDTYRQSIMQS